METDILVESEVSIISRWNIFYIRTLLITSIKFKNGVGLVLSTVLRIRTIAVKTVLRISIDEVF